MECFRCATGSRERTALGQFVAQAHEMPPLPALARTCSCRLQRKERNEDRRRNGSNVQVLVRDNNVDQALRALKKKLQREGVFREMKLRNFYEKPSEKRAREKAEAVRRARKLARKRLQREGLIAVKPRVVK
jgi:small subunit ribosomal protein S21